MNGVLMMVMMPLQTVLGGVVGWVVTKFKSRRSEDEQLRRAALAYSLDKLRAYAASAKAGTLSTDSLDDVEDVYAVWKGLGGGDIGAGVYRTIMQTGGTVNGSDH